MSAPQHHDVAAYVLGILDQPDEAAFAQHLTRCQQCRAEYRELSDLPVLLDQLKPTPLERTGPAPPSAVDGGPPLGVLLDRITAARRRQRTATWLAAAAAAVLIVAVPLVVLLPNGTEGQTAAPDSSLSSPSPRIPTTDDPTTTAPTVAGAHSISGSNAANGISATITIQDEPWGTKVYLELRGITGPLQCQLVAVSRTGFSQVVTTWHVPASGFGVPGSPLPLKVEGGVGIDQSQIARFQVTRDNGPDLLEVPT
ncbi:MAG TPA: zf-HC2 domain-containing protein [Actinophytocola sp.]|uniref:anti-sigma factor family protein n=1 Tax=Actinophytocola sp. TaxID=1872138 RepID=UPI002DDCAC27|nr:zf-HC2 domain-containing protein [Actinophytocola sp.]HEV2783572.1 zf-HC2 domain-containing protein [Actinophytocola sp.]